jgi:hypothetical protein
MVEPGPSKRHSRVTLPSSAEIVNDTLVSSIVPEAPEIVVVGGRVSIVTERDEEATDTFPAASVLVAA